MLTVKSPYLFTIYCSLYNHYIIFIFVPVFWDNLFVKYLNIHSNKYSFWTELINYARRFRFLQTRARPKQKSWNLCFPFAQGQREGHLDQLRGTGNGQTKSHIRETKRFRRYSVNGRVLGRCQRSLWCIQVPYFKSREERIVITAVHVTK